MGSLYMDVDNLLLEDLKVTITSSSLLHSPSEETNNKREDNTMFLSNIDQVLTFPVETIHFFTTSPDFSPETVVEMVKSAFERLLLPYDFLSGRLRFDINRGRYVIDCNDAGVGFLVATSEFCLEEVGDLEYPNPAFRQLVPSPSVFLGSDKKDVLTGVDLNEPLCLLQITSFKCGGFAMGVRTSHATFDGASFRAFLENLAALAAGKPLATTPCHDRHLLAARSPPKVIFPHPELFKLDKISAPDTEILNVSSSTAAAAATTTTTKFKVFRLTQKDIYKLKEKATPATPTSFGVVTAHIWRCKTLASGLTDLNHTSRVLYAVDIRSRVRPPLPDSFTGNAVLSAYGSATYRDLLDGPFSELVKAVKEGSTRIDDEYSRSVIDWGEVNRGFPIGDVFISSWWRLGFSDVEYPWGRPKYSCPVVDPKKDIVLLLPSIGGVDQGVNAIVALTSQEVEKFEDLFYQFLL